MNVLVTGSAGFIGSHLCETLLKSGHSVVGLDNMNQFYDPDLKKSNLVAIEHLADSLQKEFVFYQNDIRDQDQVAQILTEHKIELIVHLAAMAGVRPSFENPLLYSEVNVTGTLTLLEEARKAGIKKFVFASSSSVYGNNSKVPFSESDPVDSPVSPYAATKRSGELLCRVYQQVYGMSIACLRFFTVYGPRQRPDLAINKFAHLMMQGKKIPVYGDGSKSRDFTYIDDIILGVVGAIHWVQESQVPQCEIFNLGESQTTDVKALIAHLEKATDKPADIQYLPDIAGDVQTTFADITKSQRLLGYNPKIKVSEGIQKYVDWLRKKS